MFTYCKRHWLFNKYDCCQKKSASFYWLTLYSVTLLLCSSVRQQNKQQQQMISEVVAYLKYIACVCLCVVLFIKWQMKFARLKSWKYRKLITKGKRKNKVHFTRFTIALEKRSHRNRTHDNRADTRTRLLTVDD